MATINYFYTKAQIQSACSNPIQFKKELKKASNRLLPFENQQLKLWLSTFTDDKPELRQFI